MRCIKICAVFLSLSLTATPLVAVAISLDGIVPTIYQIQLFEAETQLRKAIKLNPNDADAYNNLGVVLSKQNKLEEAETQLRKAIELNPNFADAYNNLGVVLSEQNKLEEAKLRQQWMGERFLRQDFNPSYADVYYTWRDAVREQKKLDEAVAAYRKAIKLNPNFANAYNALGWVLQEQGKLEEAIQEYQQAIKLDPYFTTSQNNLKEAQRLLDLRKNPSLTKVEDDRQWLPSLQDEPLVGVLRSVVRVIAQNPTGNDIGSGWVVKREGNKALIVTNRHVVTNFERSRQPLELEFYSEPPNNKYRPRYPAKIVKITDPNNPLDLAILEVTGIPDDIKPLPMAFGRVPRTTLVRVIGHPSNGADWTVVSGEVSNFLFQQRKYQIQGTLAQGNSGGPVIDLQKQVVVGLMVEISDSNQNFKELASTNQPQIPATGGFGFAYSMDIVVEQLRSWGISLNQ
ncbi:tetratricopeptide repeat protein [Nostoc sp. CALU 1950]|uniref:tetratricopeptide repeat protein n=1 Tax=Nostoc sp. CALU 1950 TaxID=3104321 RepID=UPI003EBC10BC